MSIAKAWKFAQVCRILGAAKGDLIAAQIIAEQQVGYDNNVVGTIKAAANVGSLSELGGNYDFMAVQDSFVEALRSRSVFDTLAVAGMRRVPLQTRLTATSAGSSAPLGDVVTEGSFAPVTSMTLEAGGITPIRATSLLAMTEEAFRFTNSMPLIQLELVGGVAAATDRRFLGDLLDGSSALVATISSDGPTPSDIRYDVRRLLSLLNTTGNSKLFLVVNPSHANYLSTLPQSDESAAFPDMSPNGGTLCGLTVLVTDALPDETIGLIDADAIAFDTEGIIPSVTTQAALQMDPDDPTALLSLWQAGCVGVKVDRYFGFKAIRPAAVALSGAAW